MSWYKIAFTEPEVEDGAPGRMEKQFRQAFAAARSPKGAVLFSNELAAEGIEYYLSPEAAESAAPLLAHYRAEPCDRPRADHVRPALGHRATAQRLLTEIEDV